MDLHFVTLALGEANYFSCFNRRIISSGKPTNVRLGNYSEDAGAARLSDIGPDRRRGASRQAAPRFSVSGEIADPVPGGSAANAKRISAEGECEPVFFMTAAQWFSTVCWLINVGPAAREPHRPVADVVLPYAVKSYREALHCCDTGFFRRCSRPNQDGALLNRRVDDSLACCC
jgi:hypothetical protein